MIKECFKAHVLGIAVFYMAVVLLKVECGKFLIFSLFLFYVFSPLFYTSDLSLIKTRNICNNLLQ